MPAAAPTINGVSGSNPPNGTALVVGSTVQLNNTNTGGELTYLWEWLDKPEGSLAVFSNPNIQNPTFIADSEGTFLIRLTVNRLLASEQVATIIAAVAQLKSAIRVPAAGESTEMSVSRGWALSVNRNFQALDRRIYDGGTLVGYCNANFSTGSVAYPNAVQTLKSGLPGEEKVPSFAAALGNSATAMKHPLFVFDSKVGGGGSAVVGELGVFRRSGLIGPIALGGGVANDPIYVGNGGMVAQTIGTYARRVGTVAYVSGADYWLSIDGSAGHHEGNLFLEADAQIVQRNGPFVVDLLDAGEYLGFAVAGSVQWKILGTGELTASGGNRKIQAVADPVDPTDAANLRTVRSVSYALMAFGNTDTPAAATECALDPGFGIRTSPAVAGSYPSVTLPQCTLKNLRVAAVTGPAGAGIDVTVYLNGAPLGITCTLAIAGTSAQDIVNSANASAGDLLTIHIKGAGVVTTGAVDITATLEVHPR